MDLRPITNKQQYNKLATHVIQSWEWGEFRKSLGIPVLRYGIYKNGKLSSVFQLTLHRIPFTRKFVGYLPKGPLPDKDLADALFKIGKEYNCAFIKLEPNVILSETKDLLLASRRSGRMQDSNPSASHFGRELSAERLRAGKLRDSSLIAQNDRTVDQNFRPSPKPLFTKYNFIIDLTKSEDELLKNMHPKTRYNIKVAQKHGVKIEERIDDEAFEIYLKLYFDTTKRQGYHGHNEEYHRRVWETLKDAGMARILLATYHLPPTTYHLTAWMLLNFKDTLYYPYGGSSLQHKEVMASNAVAWEAIKLGKKMGFKKFDMWGALGPEADSKDPWYGFHRFKQGYGGILVEYIGTYDLVFDWPIYWTFTAIDKLMPLKVFLLKLISK